MSNLAEDPQPQSPLTLISGILVDLEHLVEQQLRLTRREIEQEIRQRSVATGILVAGLGAFFLAAMTLCLTMAHLLHWVTSPPGTDPASLPLWSCYAIVAALLLLSGGILAQLARVRFNAVVPCGNPVTELLQEPVP